jgi:hypothetical protein
LPTAIPGSILDAGSTFKLGQREKPAKLLKGTRQIKASRSHRTASPAALRGSRGASIPFRRGSRRHNSRTRRTKKHAQESSQNVLEFILEGKPCDLNRVQGARKDAVIRGPCGPHEARNQDPRKEQCDNEPAKQLKHADSFLHFQATSLSY